MTNAADPKKREPVSDERLSQMIEFCAANPRGWYRGSMVSALRELQDLRRHGRALSPRVSKDFPQHVESCFSPTCTGCFAPGGVPR